MSIGSQEDILGLQKVGRVVRDTIQLMIDNAVAGITTKQLDTLAREYFESFGARSAPELTYGFPGATCISLNKEVAHGIPGARVLRNGDLLNVDVSLELDGYFADAGYSFCIGAASGRLADLCSAAETILLDTIRSLRSGNKVNKIGQTIESRARQLGYQVIRDLAGHGVGRKLHEEPYDIVNYRDPSDRRLLTNGLVIAIESFISTGSQYVADTGDGWTLKCPDGSYVAQFEHTVIITNDQPIVLTA